MKMADVGYGMLSTFIEEHSMLMEEHSMFMEEHSIFTEDPSKIIFVHAFFAFLGQFRF